MVLATSGVDDPRFAGEAVKLTDGTVVLSMPPGRDPVVSDVLARGLLGRAFGVPLAPLPAPFEMTEV
ncbi:hypothetical protein [Streptomyces sp. Ac-502]|uniref:hypothetical protein n=1 Tax=Streptomyces sp. Ac-502 TaxID=3342801 RepID=UPI0038629941